MDRHAADILDQRVSGAAARPAPRNDLVLRAMRGERTERTPVWLMRQAGRFDPAYRELRARAGLELEELFAHPEHAARITALPVPFGVDAAILFQDILTPLGPMGAPFLFRPGPVLERPVRTAEDAARLEAYDPRERLGFVAESVALALEALDGAMPLLGFAGAPLTLLTFLVEGRSPGGDAERTRSFLRERPSAAEALLQRLASLTADYLRMQIEAGVHAVQLFESCAPLFDAAEYRRWALPHQQRVMAAVGPGARTPRVLFARDVQPSVMIESGADVISIGAAIPLRAAKRAIEEAGCAARAVQGNLDNILLRDGDPGQVRAAAVACVREGDQRGHVLNLGHGVLPGTPVANVQAMIDAARESAAGQSAGPEGLR